jgi:hypothetical protein
VMVQDFAALAAGRNDFQIARKQSALPAMGAFLRKPSFDGRPDFSLSHHRRCGCINWLRGRKSRVHVRLAVLLFVIFLLLPLPLWLRPMLR